MREESFKEALEAIRQSEKRIERFIKIARIDRPRREPRMDGLQCFYLATTAVVSASVLGFFALWFNLLAQ